jgi:hypothetical protein
MALALQFMDEPEVGLTHCQEALKLMESKLDELKNLGMGFTARIRTFIHCGVFLILVVASI